MADYSISVITNLGKALFAKIQAGTPMHYTRMQIGGGQLGVGQDPQALTALIDPIASFAINAISSDANTAHIRGIFENSDISESTYSCELGLFATDPELGEILYAYANADDQGDTIPPISAGPWSEQYRINTAIGNASSVTATIPAETFIPVTDKAIPNGVASLDASGKVPAAQTGATPAATANTIMQRDANGQANVGAPTANSHIARKQDVDAAASVAATAQSTANSALTRASASLPKDGSEAMTGPLKINSNFPNLELFDADGAANSRAVRVTNDGAAFWIQLYDDSGNWVRDLLKLSRDGSGGLINFDTIWTSGNDGAGSGLDADLLDGLQGAFYAQGNQQFLPSAFQNNTILPSGIYTNEGNGLLNAAGTVSALAGWWHVINMHHLQDNGYNSQIAVPLNATGADQKKIHWRNAIGGTWSEWVSMVDNNQVRVNAGNLEYFDGGTWKAAGGVKNVQRGYTATGTTQIVDVTISAVDTSKSHIASSFTIGSDNNTAIGSVRLLNSTTVRIERMVATGVATTVAWEVVEFY